MNIIRKSPDKYMLVRVAPKIHRLVKVLAEYDNEKKAANGMADLLMDDTTEEELLNKYSPSFASEVKDGKLGNRINVLEATLEGIRSNLLQAMGDLDDKLEKAARETIKKINEMVGE